MQRNPSRTIMHTKYSKYSLLRIKLSTKKPRITLNIALKLTISYNSNLKKKKNSLLKCIALARERACKWKLFRRKIIHDHHPPIRKIFVITASLALDYTLPIKVWKTRIHGRKGTIQRSNRLFYNRRKLKNRKKKKKESLP